MLLLETVLAARAKPADVRVLHWGEARTDCLALPAAALLERDRNLQ